MIEIPKSQSDMDMPPMGDMGMNNNPMPPMGDVSQDPNMMGDEDMEMEDGGDDSNDPKKEIQSLCGELSEKLRAYNEEQEEPDGDLNKFVLGMLISQATKDMTEKEKNEIIKKLESGFDSDDMPMDDGGEEEGMGGEMPQDEPPMESKKKVGKAINETFTDTLSSDDTPRKKDANARINKKNPFVSNRK